MKKITSMLLILASLVLTTGTALAAHDSYGELTETIPVGRTLAIGLNDSPTGSWYLAKHTKHETTDVELTASQVIIHGLKVGTTKILVCASGTHDCLKIKVVVTENQNAQAVYTPSATSSFMPLKNFEN